MTTFIKNFQTIDMRKPRRHIEQADKFYRTQNTYTEIPDNEDNDTRRKRDELELLIVLLRANRRERGREIGRAR